MREGHVVLNGVKIRYAEWPRAGAPYLLLLPGSGGMAGTPLQWVPLAEALITGFHAVCMTPRGHAGSDWSAPYTASQFVDDIASFMDEMHIAKAHVIGHSAGAIRGAAFASLYPDRVERFVACEGPIPPPRDAPPGDAPASRTWRTLHEMRQGLLAKWGIANELEALFDDILADATIELGTGVWGWRLDSGFKQANAQGIWNGVVAGSEIELIGEGVRAPLRTIRAPTLVMAGEHSPLAVQAGQIAAAIPDANVITIGGAGHVVHLARPREFVAAVGSFL